MFRVVETLSRIASGGVPEDEGVAEARCADRDFSVGILLGCRFCWAWNRDVAIVASNEVKESGGSVVVPVTVVAIAAPASGISVAELVFQGGVPSELRWVGIWALVSL